MNRPANDDAGVWTVDYPVRSYEVDATGRLSSTSILNLMQDAASRHAHAMGISVEHLKSEDATWVLSRLRLNIFNPPRFGETAMVQTWISGEDRRIFSLRQFQMRNDHGDIFAEATTAWLAVDMNKRRPLRISRFTDRIRTVADQEVFPAPLEELPKMDCPLTLLSLKVGYGDLDINQHTNNARYVSWLMDGAHQRLCSGQVSVYVAADYIGEARLGDTIIVCSEEVPDSNPDCRYAIRCERSGRLLMQASVRWHDSGTVQVP